MKKEARMLLLLLGMLSARAENIWPDISTPLMNIGVETNNDSALIIAIEDYSHIPDVSGAKQNGKDWESYFAKSAGIPAHRIKFLKNEDAYKENILGEAKNLAENSPSGGKIWLVYIGHGANYKSEPIFVDVDARQTETSFKIQLEQRALLSILEEKHDVVALIDACFSGQDNEGLVLLTGTQFAAPSSLLEMPKTTILTAAESDEYAGALPGLNRPAFSYLALGALRGWADENGNAEVSLSEVKTYVDTAMQAVVMGREQTPTITGNGALVASKGRESAPDMMGIRDRLYEEEEAEKKEVVEGKSVVKPSDGGEKLEKANGYTAVLIPEGSLTIGCDSEQDADCEKLSIPQFYLMESEVTQEFYKEVVDANPSSFKGPNRPVDSVSWLRAVWFANALSEKEGLEVCYSISEEDVSWDKMDCNGWRLPTEVEWIYAARGPAMHVESTSEKEEDVVNPSENTVLGKRSYKGTSLKKLSSNDKSYDVCRKERNGYGLCDMSGNLFEWVWDDGVSKSTYNEGLLLVLSGSLKDSVRLLGGGLLANSAKDSRMSNQFSGYIDYYSDDIGFRLARTP
jgi:formylglycine-generating enzyme required for sulfatase activity